MAQETRPGREAGTLCRAACMETGRTNCTCHLVAAHTGNMHTCFGSSNHMSHSWPIAGAEIPVAPPLYYDVECPRCGNKFNTADSGKNMATQQPAIPGGQNG